MEHLHGSSIIYSFAHLNIFLLIRQSLKDLFFETLPRRLASKSCSVDAETDLLQLSVN